MKKHILGITGASGFIGSHFLLNLSHSRYTAVIFRGSLLNKTDIHHFFKTNNITSVIHLVGTFFLPFKKLIDLNLIATQNLLEVGSTYNIKKIIYASSGAVYGEPIGEESFEDDPLRPNTLYGLTKKWAEECIQFYGTQHKIQYVILRFPNVYGPNNNKGVIYNFLKDIKEKGEITIEGDGSASRNFLHVTDACSAIYNTIEYSNSDIFNISNSEKTDINRLATLLSQKYKFKIKHTSSSNNLNSLLLNSDKAKKKLNFEAKIKNIVIK